MRRTESDLIRAILTYLKTVPRVVAWRMNSGAVVGEYKGQRRFVRFNTMPGISDIIGWWSRDILSAGAFHDATTSAVFLAIEAKMPGKKPTREQAAFLETVRKSGGIAILAYSVDDVIKEIR